MTGSTLMGNEKVKAREIAEAVANHLFTNGANEMADRLRLVSETAPWSREAPRDLGGWSKSAVIDVIERVIRQGNTDAE